MTSLKCIRPRVAELALEHGLRHGFSFGLVECAADGEQRILNEPHLRDRAIRKLNEDQLERLILSPTCGPFSHMQGFNYSMMFLDQLKAKFREAITHLEFVMHMCRLQFAKRRLITFERPAGARSWITNIAKEILKLPGVMTVDFDFGCYS